MIYGPSLNSTAHFSSRTWAATSRFAAASSQIAPEKKSAFYERLSELALRLTTLERPILVYRDYIDGLAEHGVDPELLSAMKEFVEFSESAHILCLPLKYALGRGRAFDPRVLRQEHSRSQQRGSIGKHRAFPCDSAHPKSGCWKTNPALVSVIRPGTRVRTGMYGWLVKRLRFLVPCILVILVILFLVPFSYTVGGEAEIAPGERHFAFCKIDGLIRKVFAREGAFVKQGQILAVIDPKKIGLFDQD